MVPTWTQTPESTSEEIREFGGKSYQGYITRSNEAKGASPQRQYILPWASSYDSLTKAVMYKDHSQIQECL